MFGLGVPELLLIAVIVTFLFGSSRLPKLGGAVAGAIANFRDGLRGGSKEDR
jgi:TatA/E family protein of Tat protein translocase